MKGVVTDPAKAVREELHTGDVNALLCWRCGTPICSLGVVLSEQIGMCGCIHCGATTSSINGIWLCLAPERVAYLRRFVEEYEFIRSAEGRKGEHDDYYLALPYKDLSGRNVEQWKIRARTFNEVLRSIIKPLAGKLGRPLRILDLGAGNGWMSYRLSVLGHSLVAADILTNDEDGLEASTHYRRLVDPLFPRVQADLDRLPFPSSSFDLAIFNASFHYSENYELTLAEALRCTRPGGSVVIADTAWYADEASGRQMVKEKHRRFRNVYGFPSNSLASLEFLTPDRLERLAEAFQFQWKVIEPFYGVRWALRPLKARLARRRTPSRFRIYSAEVPA